MRRERCWKITTAGILFGTLCVGILLVGNSAPAPIHIVTLSQPDGSSFAARLWGDEWVHGWETANGYTIVRADDGSLQFADRGAQGELVPSGKTVGRSIPPPRSLHLRPAPASAAQARSRADSDLEAAKMFPPTGTRKVLVILIDFADATHAYTSGTLHSLLFGTGVATGPGNMVDYYREISYGNLTLFGTTAGWVSGEGTWQNGPDTRTLPDARVVNRGTHDYYGDWDSSDSYGFQRYLVRDAIAAVDPYVDFSQFDNDGDGYVDGLIVVHQGASAEAGDLSNIWSHRGWLWPGGVYADGVRVYDYAMQPETLWGGLTSIGVFCHEFGHLMGLTDLYDTDSSTEGAGEWALMASGSWNQSGTTQGDCPGHMIAYHKWLLGWLTPTEITDPTGEWQMTIPGVEMNPFAVQLEPNPSGCQCPDLPDPSAGEYFLVENRTQQGFGAGQPGTGLLITHIWEANPESDPCANDNYPAHLVQVEEADGNNSLVTAASRGEPGDLWQAGTSSQFSDTTTPNSRFHDGTPSNACVSGIGAPATTMTASFGSSGCASLPASTAAVFRVDDAGNVYADGPFYGAGFSIGAADVAEWVSVSGLVEPGTVLELDPEQPGAYRPSQGACSFLVGGVVSTEPGFVLGSPTPYSLPTPNAQALLALSGIVPVKVTNEGGPIHPGDLLVSSSTPGYAMRWSGPNPCPCAIVGKALDALPLGQESGLVSVLLTAH